MKKTYLTPEILEVCLQHHGIICTSPNGYDGKSINMSGGTGNQISDENSVWTKESSSVWDEEW